MGLRYYGPNGPVDVSVEDYVRKVVKPKPYLICKDCKHYEKRLDLHGVELYFCRGNDYLAPNKVTGEMEWQHVQFAKRAREKGQPCGLKAKLFEAIPDRTDFVHNFFKILFNLGK